MDVHDDYVPENLYAEFVAHFPQVCVEILLRTADGILLAERNNDPQVWFWPGARLYKGEDLRDAAHRVADEELGVEVHVEERLGVYAHFWDEGDLLESRSRHTVNVVFVVEPANEDFEIVLDDQHDAYQFVSTVEPWMHEYVRQYLQDLDRRT